GRVSLRMVPVKVGVDEVTHRSVRYLFLNLRDQGGRGRRLRVGIHHKHIARQNEDRGVAVRQGGGFGEGGEHAISDFFDVEQIGGRGLGLRSHPACAKKRLLENRRSGKD